MKHLLRFSLLLIIVSTLSGCAPHSHKEDPIITDLNIIFDPDHTDETDWNYTEVDPEWMADLGLYYDPAVGEIRQKYEYAKKYGTLKRLKHQSKPINPINAHLWMIGIILLSFMCFLCFASYKQADKLHRIKWIWICNCITGGVGSFIILALSPALKYDKDLDVRTEPDWLGICIFAGNATFLLILYLLYKLCIKLLLHPEIAADFIKPWLNL